MSRHARIAVTVAALVLLAMPAMARDSLGMFASWGAFRDARVPRCYAIAAPLPDRKAIAAAYADIAWWPRRGLRGQVHLRLSRPADRGRPIALTIDGRTVKLVSDGTDAWAADRRGDAAIVAGMRSARSFRVTATGANGRRFADRYPLEGAATAMDAAALGCARL